ncbi:molybdopterin synthase/thiamin biosynthesis sulphur carrier beta-grasp [Desulfoluna butyratoxydans]|uniref:Molybdopterin synthase/thiamin biosynthesis sulphur carrier beta-grasp n=2 Tax=Desulfoluna butyratoxydans TaxID=231438 RepID=A0A4U8YLZ1_9BACT|nr:molybdopterin synthase/thiamin biosynthesis sulphur carrier beta-grasp [Desulfoluna butyratoxydans]
MKPHHRHDEPMKLELKLFATLRPYLKGTCEDGTLEVPDNTTVADVIELLKLPEEQVRLIFVNGRHADRDRELCAGDRLGIFPPVGGG